MWMSGTAVETPSNKNKNPRNFLLSGLLNCGVKLNKKTEDENVIMKVRYIVL